MRWFLTVDGSTASTRGSSITEFGIDPDPTIGAPFLQERRRWAPRQADSGGVRDVAYQTRDTRVDWQGHLTEHEWQRGNQCLEYVVSDGDIFLAGAQGEHYWELARGFQKIEFSIDGQLKATLTEPLGTWCFPTDSISSGVHTLTAKAWTLDGTKVVTATNDDLHIDHDPPTGEVDPPPRYVTGTVTISGQMADAHSGPRDWQLQRQSSGGAWTDVCGPSGQPDAIGKHRCDWNTRAVPDGPYDLRGSMRDNVQTAYGGPNNAATASVSTFVDNTAPGLSLSGELWDRRDGQPIWFDEAAQLGVNTTDSGAGVKSVEILVDGARSDFVEQPCDHGGCPLDRTYTFDASIYRAGGDHTIAVTARDQLGHSESMSWTVRVKSQAEAEAPEPGPLDTPPSSYPVRPVKPVDNEPGSTDTSYGDGNLDDFCNPDPDVPSTDCSATIHDPAPEDAPEGSSSTAAPATTTPDLPLPAGPELPDLSVAAAAGPSVPLRPGGTGWGLSDNTSEFWGNGTGDERFNALGVRNVRLQVSWDLIPRAEPIPEKPCESELPEHQDVCRVDGWLTAARNTGKRALVSFWFNWINPQAPLPDVKTYGRAVRKFRNRYKWVREFTAWNEPDLRGYPPKDNAYLIGRYWRRLNWQCINASPPCRVAAGDFSDKHHTENYFNRYLDGAGHLPPLWAWHAYEDGHDQFERDPRGAVKLRAFLKATRYKNHADPAVWLTEQGGRVNVYGLARATEDFEWMLNNLPRVSSRIKRFYAYQWKRNATATWDSGLIDPDTDEPRFMYSLYKQKTNP